MRMLMDENICNFTLAEANNARKIVGKKTDVKDSRTSTESFSAG